MSTKKIEFNVKGIERIKEGVMAVYNRAEYETQHIEAAHKMHALIMQIIQP
jgi:hypothetical protein